MTTVNWKIRFGLKWSKLLGIISVLFRKIKSVKISVPWMTYQLYHWLLKSWKRKLAKSSSLRINFIVGQSCENTLQFYTARIPQSILGQSTMMSLTRSPSELWTIQVPLTMVISFNLYSLRNFLIFSVLFWLFITLYTGTYQLLFKLRHYNWMVTRFQTNMLHKLNPSFIVESVSVPNFTMDPHGFDLSSHLSSHVMVSLTLLSLFLLSWSLLNVTHHVGLLSVPSIFINFSLCFYFSSMYNCYLGIMNYTFEKNVGLIIFFFRT